MRRRGFITLIGGVATTWPLALRAQQPGRMRRVGIVMAFAENDLASKPRMAAFTEGLRQFGWSVGGNVQIEVRWGAAEATQARRYAAELAALRSEGHTSELQSLR